MCTSQKNWSQYFVSKNKLKKKENQYFLAKDKVTRESQYPYRQKSVLIADKVLKEILKKNIFPNNG